jgi:putative tributyrin esterase
MPFCDFHFFSPNLGKQLAAYVITPSVGKPPYPVFYLLHGLSDDHTIWLRRTRIEWYVRDLPLIVVMPDGFRGFYTDNQSGPAYAKYMGEDLPSAIETNFHAKPGRSARCIGGLSMGGYGALRVALGYPDRFISANSHSGALEAGLSKEVPANTERVAIFGKRAQGTPHDLLHLASSIQKAGGRLPGMRIDCGTEDFLLNQNRGLHAKFEKAGIPHEYAEYPGAHSWDYWDLHVQEALQFHARHLKLKWPTPA